MSGVLLDTHAWICSLMDSARLGEGVKTAILEADAVHVSPISVYEVVRKARLGKWPEIAPHINTLLTERQTVAAPFTRAVAARAGASSGPIGIHSTVSSPQPRSKWAVH